MRPGLQEKLDEAVRKVAAMPTEEKEAMMQAQQESWVRSVVDRPKPKFRWENGVKVYDSYEDYCND